MGTQTLFRLVTVAQPQLLNEEQKNRGFIFHPSLTAGNSDFFAAVENEEDYQDIKSQLETTANGFSAFETYKDVKDVNIDMHQFGLWLNGNLQSIKVDDLNSRVSGLTALTDQQKYDLWDNLFYQAVTNKSNSVVDAIITMLIGNYFYEQYDDFIQNTSPTPTEFTDEQKQLFIRIGKSKVVIPKKIGVRRNRLESGTESQEKYFSSWLYDNQTSDIAKKKIDILSEAMKELKVVHSEYKKEVKEEKHDHYKSNINQYIDDVEAAEANVGSGLLHPVHFPKFTPRNTFDSSYTSSKVSSDTQQIISEFENTSAHSEMIEAVKSSVEEAQKKYAEKLFSTKGMGNKTLLFNNTTINLKDVPKGNMVSVTLEPLIHDGSKFSLFITQYFSSQENRMRSIDISLTPQGSSAQNDSALPKNYSAKEFITVELFEDGISISETTAVDISITVNTVSDNQMSTEIKSLFAKDTQMSKLKTASTSTDTYQEPILYGVTNLGTAVFRKVEQEICHYVEGEVSHIENVMAKEYKERSTRSLNRSETTTVEETEEETEKMTDTSTTDRFEMQSEVEKVLEEQKFREHGWAASVHGSFGPKFNYAANGFGNYGNSSSSTESTNQAVEQSKEVTEKVVERIVKKVKTARTSIMLKEFEDINKHGFDNREGSAHVTGVYRWVDKIFRNKLVNYGRRQMFEISVPEPAKNFKDSLKNTSSLPSNIVLLEEPQHPEVFGIESPEDINEFNFGKLAGMYGAQVPEYPTEVIKLSKSYSETSGGNFPSHNVAKSFNDFLIPEGYECFEVVVRANMTNIMDDAGVPSGYVLIADKKVLLPEIAYGPAFTEEEKIVFLHNVEDILSVSLTGTWGGTITVSMLAYCRRKWSHYWKWQAEAYSAIMQGYKAQREEYNQQAAVTGQEGLNDLTINPAYSRSIERNELKRICIELLTRPFGIQTARNNYSNDGSSIQKVNATAEFEKHASHVKFLEQAFDWDIMAYVFYPYYYANEDKWHELMNSSNNSDSIFQSFLQSGMAKVVVPVRPGFEEAVNFYTETGVIWNGTGFTLDSDDDLYLSIEEELETPEETVEDTWMSTVPTSLKIIQQQSAALPGDGLPSFCENGEPIATGTSTLGGSTEPTP